MKSVANYLPSDGNTAALYEAFISARNAYPAFYSTHIKVTIGKISGTEKCVEVSFVDTPLVYMKGIDRQLEEIINQMASDVKRALPTIKYPRIYYTVPVLGQIFTMPRKDIVALNLLREEEH